METELNSGELLLQQKKSNIPTIATSLLVLILGVLIVFYLFFGLTTVDGTSMEETIFDKEQVFLLKAGFSVERGDIVTINVGTKKAPRELIKRVIAISGDKLVYVRDSSNTYVDLYLCKAGETKFTMLDERYIKERMHLSFFTSTSTFVTNFYDKQTIESIDLTKEYSGGAEDIRKSLLDAAITVPAGQFYFLGDNRNVSKDSRDGEYGTRNYSSINGKLLTILDDGSAASKVLNFLF